MPGTAGQTGAMTVERVGTERSTTLLSTQSADVLDVIGIGFGPSNIALAVALEEISADLNVAFLERRREPAWQPGMMLHGSDIQHHPMRDLVTPRNPRSRYTFMNYLFEDGRLFEFLNLSLPFPLRKDYARYVTWVADQFADQVRFGAAADSVKIDDGLVCLTLADGQQLRSRSVVVAPGRAPKIPAPFQGVEHPRIVHFTRYLEWVHELTEKPDARIAVVGASQSAVELVLDLSHRFPDNYIHNIIRGFGYRQKDLSPFHGEIYFPEYVDYYFDSPETSKQELDRQLRYTNYSSADIDVLNSLHARMYEQRLDGDRRIELTRNTEILRCTPGDDDISLELFERHRGTTSTLKVDAVILATGFTDLTDDRGPELLPQVLAPIAPLVGRTSYGRALIGRDYRVQPVPGHTLPPIYLNGLCETTHGMGDAGSFSLIALRSAVIAESLNKALAL
jgi:L-ornithine N5-oxygenase